MRHHRRLVDLLSQLPPLDTDRRRSRRRLSSPGPAPPPPSPASSEAAASDDLLHLSPSLFLPTRRVRFSETVAVRSFPRWNFPESLSDDSGSPDNSSSSSSSSSESSSSGSPSSSDGPPDSPPPSSGAAPVAIASDDHDEEEQRQMAEDARAQDTDPKVPPTRPYPIPIPRPQIRGQSSSGSGPPDSEQHTASPSLGRFRAIRRLQRRLRKNIRQRLRGKEAGDISFTDANALVGTYGTSLTAQQFSALIEEAFQDEINPESNGSTS